jgi:hypothetical protein
MAGSKVFPTIFYLVNWGPSTLEKLRRELRLDIHFVSVVYLGNEGDV